MDKSNLFASDVVQSVITESEWAKGWAAITSGSEGVPTSQQFDYVFYLLSKYILENANGLEATNLEVGKKVNSADVTPRYILDKLKEIDGANSGLDADLLDGKNSTDFVLSANYTAEKIKELLSGSASGGLNADTLGNKAPSAFAASSHSHNASDITGGVLPVARGGTGVSDLSSAVVGFDVDDTSVSNIGASDNMGVVLKKLHSLIANAFLKSGGSLSGTISFGTSGKNINTSGDANLRNVSASKVTGAVYNDYAEFFPKGEETEPGDIIALNPNGEDETYIKAVYGMRTVGVHTNEWSHLIGGDDVPAGVECDFFEYNKDRFIPVGLVGRVHCKVVGCVDKGDWIIPSDVPGVGRAVKHLPASVEPVGFAVSNSTDVSIKLVKIKLGRA